LIESFFQKELPIKIGGNKWTFRVEPDERTSGRRAKGAGGHNSYMKGNYWSCCGPHHTTGKEIWICEP